MCNMEELASAASEAESRKTRMGPKCEHKHKRTGISL